MVSIPPPGELGLNIASWRPGQEQAIVEVLAALEKTDTAVLHGPPATGKSLVATAVSRLSGLHTLILTGTKALQARYADPPTSLPTMTGRQNHPCAHVDGVTAADGPYGIGLECPERHTSCVYFGQRDEAIKAPIAVANYALILSDIQGALLADRDLVIADEAHLLEGQAAQYFAVEIDLEMARYGLEGLPTPPTEFTVPAYQSWAETAAPLLDHHVEYHHGRVAARAGHLSAAGLRYVHRLTRLAEAVSQLRELDNTWVPVVGRPDRSGLPKDVTFKPLNVGPLLQRQLWLPDTKRLLMSGSIGDAAGLVSSLGAGDYTEVLIKSIISAERRLIFYQPVADLTDKNYTRAAMAVGRAIEQLAIEFREYKMIVHAVSFDLAGYVEDVLLGHQVFSHTKGNRADVFEGFRRAAPPAVLVSPSGRLWRRLPRRPGESPGSCQSAVLAPGRPVGEGKVR